MIDQETASRRGAKTPHKQPGSQARSATGHHNHVTTSGERRIKCATSGHAPPEILPRHVRVAGTKRSARTHRHLALPAAVHHNTRERTQGTRTPPSTPHL